MAADKARSPAMDFLVSSLEKDKKATYADLKAAADKKGLKVFPIMFGRAQAMLGIVKSAKRGTGKTARATAARAAGGGGAAPAKRGRPVGSGTKSERVRELLKTGMSAADIAEKVGSTTGLVYNIKSSMGRSASGGTPKRGPGRPRKVTVAIHQDGLAGIVEAVRSAERDKTRMRQALERIRAVLDDVLA